MRYAISYVSTASSGISESEIEDILNKAESNNNKSDITGLLLFSEGNFFQVLEGEESKIKSIFEVIEKDDRHFNIIKLFGKHIHQDAFDGYKSDFISENSKYSISQFRTYDQYIKVLDNQTQNAVRNILDAFMR